MSIWNDRIALRLSLCIALGCGGHAAEEDAARPRELRSPSRPMDASAAQLAAPTDAAAPDAGPPEADDDAGFPPPSCGDGECDLLDPLSCPESDGCVLLSSADSTGSLASCTVAGEGRDGDGCDDHTQCGPGLDCTGVGGSCRRHCCTLNQAAGCPGGQFCRVALTDAEGAHTGVGLCDACDGCDVLDANACGHDLGCYALPGGGTDGCLACLPAGLSAAGEGCETANACEPGSACFSVGGDRGRCLAFCSIEDGGCEGALECKRVTGITLPPAVGLCMEPGPGSDAR